jgi:hypothetical protein
MYWEKDVQVFELTPNEDYVSLEDFQIPLDNHGNQIFLGRSELHKKLIYEEGDIKICRFNEKVKTFYDRALKNDTTRGV